MDGRLLVEFCGEEHLAAPGSVLSFGRSGDLEIDDNPYLHRLLGRFVQRGGLWWLDHLGSRTPMTLREVGGGTVTTLAPGSSTAVPRVAFVLCFSAGPTNYELSAVLEDHDWAVDLLGPDGLAGTATLDWGRVELNEDQRLLLVALCEARLRDPADLDAPLPSNRAGAHRLGWSLPKFNRKLDHLCQKLHRAGVVGVHGDAGASAVDRRRRVVDHAIESRLVTCDDLSLVDGAGGAVQVDAGQGSPRSRDARSGSAPAA